MDKITFTIIKPNAVEAGNTEKIFAMIEADGFRLKARRELTLTKEQAGEFYAVHAGKPFYEPLVEFMTSGPAVVALLEREDAVRELRRLAGATDPAEAAEGTIRRIYGENVRRNAIHASDSEENALKEAGQFFTRQEIFG